MLRKLLGTKMKLENMTSGWFAVLLIVTTVGLSGCCSERCRLGKAFGARQTLNQEFVPASSCGCETGGCQECQGALTEYHSQPVTTGSATRTAAVSGSSTRTAANIGSATKSCGTT